MADKTGYIGRNPADSSVIIARQTFEPTGVQHLILLLQQDILLDILTCI